MVDELSLEEDVLKHLRKSLSKQAVSAVAQAPKLFVSPDDDVMQYGYLDESGQPVKPPKKPGIYVLYSRATDRPVYVGESDHLKRQLDHEIRPSGITDFKTQWLREWLNLPNRRLSSEDMRTIARFMADNLYIKFLVLYFGRAEIATDLALDFKLRVGPKAVDFSKEFKDWEG